MFSQKKEDIVPEPLLWPATRHFLLPCALRQRRHVTWEWTVIGLVLHDEHKAGKQTRVWNNSKWILKAKIHWHCKHKQCLYSVAWIWNTTSAQNCVYFNPSLCSVRQRKKLHTKKIIIFYLSSSISHFFISLLFKLTPSSGSDKKATEVWWIDSRCKPKADQRVPNLGQLPSLVKKIIQEKVKTYVQSWFFNPSHPNLSMHILYTVLYSFPQALTRRICLTINKASLVGDHFLYSRDVTVWFKADIVWRNKTLVALRS